MLDRNFICWKVGYGAKVGDRWRPMTVADRALKGPIGGEPGNFFREGSTTVGGHVYASLNFRAQVRICAHHPHMCTLDSILVWLLALIPRWFSRSSFFSVRKGADSRHRAYWTFLIRFYRSRRLLLSPSKCCNYISIAVLINFLWNENWPFVCQFWYR